MFGWTFVMHLRQNQSSAAQMAKHARKGKGKEKERERKGGKNAGSNR